MEAKLLIKLLDSGMAVPRYAHPGDAGLDLPSRIDLVLEPGERALIPTGLAVAIPEGYAGFVLPRSGLAVRHGITMVNAPGLIDSGYRGEVAIILLNTDRNQPFEIKRGDRIGQLVLQRVVTATVEITNELDATARGEGGFGSTSV